MLSSMNATHSSSIEVQGRHQNVSMQDMNAEFNLIIRDEEYSESDMR